MRVTIAMPSTGLVYAPGLAAPVVLESAALPEADAARLAALVRDAKILDRPAAVPEAMPRSTPDARRVTVTVEEGGKQRVVQLAEPIGDPALKALVDFLQDQARAHRAARRQP